MHIESPYRPEPAPPRAPKPPAAAAPAPPQPQAAPAPPPGAAPAPPSAPAAEPVPAAAGHGEPLSRMRKSIGEHMKRSLEIAAHCTTIVECDMSAVERRRKQIGTTALPIVARCVVETLREFPALNAWLEGDTFTQHDQVHLGIAVSLGGDGGLIVPVVHDAQDLSDEGLGRRIRELARRARDRQLSPDDVRGGTFTITNPGQFGAIAATPIINQPQVAILDLEAVVKRPVVVEQDGGDAIAIRPMSYLCMSWDHRALDGAEAARFLAAIRSRLEGWVE
jgi:pyruvate/2-oxoglutarate dehydrogenase complex dihydrolipoamide acyltransferase (E2) component